MRKTDFLPFVQCLGRLELAIKTRNAGSISFGEKRICIGRYIALKAVKENVIVIWQCIL